MKPLESTHYAVADGAQIVVPGTADERFRANIKVPFGAGKVVIAEWDFPGVGNYSNPANIGAIRPEVDLQATLNREEARPEATPGNGGPRSGRASV